MKKLFFTAVLLAATVCMQAKSELSNLRTNGLKAPVGVSCAEQPRLSWIIESDKQNVTQKAYRLTVKIDSRVVWDSGRVNSSANFGIPYAGPLMSDRKYVWTVQVWDSTGTVSTATSSFATGLEPLEMQAQWIGKEKSLTPIYFKSLCLAFKKIRRATAYISAKGIYQVQFNTKTIGNGVLTPGWTAYNKRIQYQAYDVTSMMKKGANSIHAIVAPGWYGSGMGWGDPAKRFIYGEDLALLFQINIQYEDGSEVKFCSGKEWLISDEGPVSFANIYDGQTIDHNIEYDWQPVKYVRSCNPRALAPTESELVVRKQVLKPLKLIIAPNGDRIIDFGQNIVGWERINIRGKKGTTITVRHAEVLDKDGNMYTENMRRARTTSTFVLAGNKKGESFEPNLTFYGFRYISVEGLDTINLEDFEAVAISSGFDDVGSFLCSNATINQLQSNIWWSFHDNFVDIPTDCPQRDERLGWTGDAQVFFRTATFNGRVENFFRKWMKDLAADQRFDGSIPRVIPDIFPDSEDHVGATGWADACTIIPWQHYMAYGDKKILADQYDSMRHWADWCINQAEPNNWVLDQNLGRHYGDWLAYSKPDDPSGVSAVTSKALCAQAFFVGTLDIMAKSCAALGKKQESRYYETALANAKDAFMNEFVTPNGRVTSDTQTAYVLALYFDILPEDMRTQAADRLVKNIESYNYHITTGFLGTPHICEVLSRFGHSDVAYKLLLQDTCPSWIYPIYKGATTIWERWDSIKPDGSIIKGMNSFNHYSLGAIGDWLYRYALGIRETSPGYATFEVDPNLGGDFSYMQGATMTPYGRISVRWEASKNRLTRLIVDVPVGTKARINVRGSWKEVGSGHYEY